MTKRQLWLGVAICVTVILVAGIFGYVSINGQKAEVDKAEAVQDGKSDRGHWIWGHFSDRKDKKD